MLLFSWFLSFSSDFAVICLCFFGFREGLKKLVRISLVIHSRPQSRSSLGHVGYKLSRVALGTRIPRNHAIKAFAPGPSENTKLAYSVLINFVRRKDRGLLFTSFGEKLLIEPIMTTDVLRIKLLFFFYVGEESTLFVVLIQADRQSYLWDYRQNWERKFREMIGKKLAFIPGTKLVVTSGFSAMKVGESISSETLEVHLSESGALIAMLELLNKRLETLDLISVMLELERHLKLSDINFTEYSHGDIQIRENLSCVPKLQKRNNARSGENRSLPEWNTLLLTAVWFALGIQYPTKIHSIFQFFRGSDLQSTMGIIYGRGSFAFHYRSPWVFRSYDWSKNIQFHSLKTSWNMLTPTDVTLPSSFAFFSRTIHVILLGIKKVLQI